MIQEKDLENKIHKHWDDSQMWERYSGVVKKYFFLRIQNTKLTVIVRLR